MPRFISATAGKTIAAFAFAALASGSAHAQNVSVYSNITNYLGAFTTTQGPTSTVGANTQSAFYADDLTLAPGFGGQVIKSVSFSVYNDTAATFTVRARFRLFDSNGTNGGPGSYLSPGYSPGVTIAPGLNILTYPASTASLTTVLPASGKIWAGIFFDNAQAAIGAAQPATAAQIGSLGQGVFGPPSIGSSSDVYFASGATDSTGFVASNPAGTIIAGPIGGQPANFGWQIQVVAVPEPSSFGLVALGLVSGGGVLARRRRRSAK